MSTRKIPLPDLRKAKAPPPGRERRYCPRSLFDPQPVIQVLVRPSFTPLRALVHDASPHGLALLLHSHLEPGSVLAVRLRKPAHGTSCILSARVIHSTPHPHGGWLIGCRLSRPLRRNEL